MDSKGRLNQSFDHTRNKLNQAQESNALQMKSISSPIKQGANQIMNNSTNIQMPQNPRQNNRPSHHLKSNSDAGQLQVKALAYNSGQNTSQNSLRNSFYKEKEKVIDAFSKTQSNFDFAPQQSPANLNLTQKYEVSVQDVVNSNLKKQAFGIDFYSPPKVERAYLLKPKMAQFSKSKVTNFAALEAKSKAYVPGPEYNTTFDWNKSFSLNRGKFLKSQRLTIPMEIIKNKDKGTPSPGLYETSVWKKFEQSVTGNYKQRADRHSFIEEASFLGEQSPSANYNQVNFDQYKSRSQIPRIYKSKETRFEKIAKKDGPAPGSYLIEESIRKTQWVSKIPAVDKSKLTSFVDVYNNLHKHSPGVGSYKEPVNAFDKLSKSPRSLMTKRH